MGFLYVGSRIIWNLYFVLQFLNHCNMVYMMKGGFIFDRGTHDELMDKEEDYAMLVKTHYSERGNQAQ